MLIKLSIIHGIALMLQKLDHEPALVQLRQILVDGARGGFVCVGLDLAPDSPLCEENKSHSLKTIANRLIQLDIFKNTFLNFSRKILLWLLFY